MYFKNYDPTLHDVYIYDLGNTGYPIALNENCLIYGASASYQSISLRERDWIVEGNRGGPPEGTALKLYPNYYNIGYALYWWVSDTMLGACTHFSTDKPCDTTPSFPLVKETGLTASYGRYYWDAGFSSKTFYDNFRGVYNCVTYEPDVDIPRYFQGWSGGCGACEAQAPGYSLGATYYQITTTDHSFSRLPIESSPNVFTGKKLRAISPLGVLTQEQISGLTQYLVFANSTDEFELGNIVYEFPVSDVYFWGGNDTIQPVSKLRLGYRQLEIIPNLLWSNPSNVYKRGPFIKMIFEEEEEAELWAGDSSGLLLYMKDGELFSIMSLLTTAGVGDLHSSTVLPNMQYMLSQTDIKSTYFYSNRGTGTAANKAGFSAAYLAMANVLVNAQNKYVELTTIPIAPSGLTASEPLPNGTTLTWQDNSNNEVGFKIFYYIPSVYPEAPSGLTALNISENGVTLEWIDYSSNEDGFKIFFANPSIIDGEVTDLDTQQSGSQNALVSWEYSGDDLQLEGFEILRGNSPLTRIATVDNEVRSYFDSGLTIGVTYSYAIRGYRGIDLTPESSIVKKRIIETPGVVEPAPPENLIATAKTPNSVELKWNKGTDLFAGEPDGYLVYRGLSIGGPFRLIHETRGVTNYTVERLQPDTRHYFNVAAYNSGGTSGLSNISGATTPPQTPIGFNVTAVATEAIALSWQIKTFRNPSESFYNIYRSRDGILFRERATIESNRTSYLDRGLISGSTYWYKINVQNSGGTSPFTQTIARMPLTYPASPSGLTSIPPVEFFGVTLNWSDNSSNEDGFKIFYKQ